MVVSQRGLTLAFFGLVVILGGVFVLNHWGTRASVGEQNKGGGAGRVAGALSPLKLQSPAFADQEEIPPRYTCDGENVNPPLEIKDVPQEAKSLALLLEDVDASGGSFWHWFVGNIDPRLKLIRENSVPAGSFLGLNDFGRKAYGGPCPPSGRHRYLFRLYALDKELPFLATAIKRELMALLQDHILAQTTLTGFYRR